MKMRSLTALLLCLLLSCTLLAVPAMAADPGVYTGYMVTDYYNPDTGEVDDGGTANAALGEGMCRSATSESALVEVDRDGNVWVTIRLLLQSNCNNISFGVRTGYNTYSPVNYSVTSEDYGNDSVDFRIPVGYEGTILRCSMYVGPMGRDVVWYAHVDPSSMTPGSGDFVVSIDTSEPETTEPEPPATTEPKETQPKETEPKETQPKETEPKATEPKETQPKETEPKETEPKATEPKATQPKETQPKATEPKATESKEPGTVTETTDATGPKESKPAKETQPETKPAKETKPATKDETQAETQETDSESQATEPAAQKESKGISGGVVVSIIVAVILIGGGVVIYFVRKKQ